MPTIFWTDPHLGLNRTSHTTPMSRKALRQALYAQALTIVEWGRNESVCLGDLFDTTENDEIIIAQGADIASRCALMLSGNHDLANRDGRMSSLELVGTLAADSSIAIDDDSDSYFSTEHSDCSITTIPHKRTQELFDQTVGKASQSGTCKGLETRILLLHCNYASGFATDEASLNLTKEQAALLLTAFDYILIGHEHIPRADFDGRLQILGNTHPTSFSDISDKFTWHLDSDKKLVSSLHWAKEDHYVVMDWEVFISFPEGVDAMWEELQFIEIVGIAPAARLPEIAKAVQKLWGIAPNAYMIRNNVKAEALVVDQIDIKRALDVPARITEELQGSALLPLWTSYLSRI